MYVSLVVDYIGYSRLQTESTGFRLRRVQVLLRALRIASRTYLRLGAAISGPRRSPVSSQRAFCVAHARWLPSRKFLKLIVRGRENIRPHGPRERREHDDHYAIHGTVSTRKEWFCSSI